MSSQDVKNFLSRNRGENCREWRRTVAGTCKDNACTACRIFDTAIGWCGMVMAQGKILRIFIGYTKPNLLMKCIIEEFGREVCLSPGGTMAIEAIRRYCAGEKVDLAGLPMDWSSLTAFQQKVLKAAMRIPYGTVETYGSLARKIGMPKGSRAVGNALANNPFPLLVPCHRIVRGDGTMGGFSAGEGISLKKMLLTMEGLQEEKKSVKR